MLYIVATPIGNLKDITLRALDVLRDVDMIACEDTRRTKLLLNHYNIQTPTTSYFQHNRFTKGEYLLGLLKQGKDIALVSDAGTPGILDPGYHLINEAVKHNIELTSIPGPTALIDALVLSGKPAHAFHFEGFLPQKSISRRNRLKTLLALECTVIFYESCHRILKTLEDIHILLPHKEIVCARELTKKFEEVIRAKPEAVIEHLKGNKIRGEFVVIL